MIEHGAEDLSHAAAGRLRIEWAELESSLASWRHGT
jgi:hypothetical protein